VASYLCPIRPSATYVIGVESAGSYNEEGYKVTRLKYKKNYLCYYSLRTIWLWFCYVFGGFQV